MSLTKETLDKNNEVTAEESSSQPEDGDTDFFGPALPPHLLNKGSSESNKKDKIIGPVLPDHIRIELNAHSSEEHDSTTVGGQEVSELTSEKEEREAPELSDDDNFGPSTTLMATGDVSGVYRFMKAEHSSEKSTNESAMKRETWMMELPEKKRPTLGSLPRHFKTAAQQIAEGDDSVWTDTPADRKKKEGHKKKDHKKILEVKRLEERDKEMEKLARKAAKKMKKQESLLEMHLKKMKKKKKKEAKKKEEGKAVPERRPFDRNVDLQIRKIDENQRRAFLNKSPQAGDDDGTRGKNGYVRVMGDEVAMVWLGGDSPPELTNGNEGKVCPGCKGGITVGTKRAFRIREYRIIGMGTAEELPEEDDF